MAKLIIDENENFFGQEVTELAKEKIDKDNKEKGGKEDDKKAKTKTRRTRKTV